MNARRVAGRHYVASVARGRSHCAAPKATFPRAVDRNREKRRCRAILRGIPGSFSIRITRSTADVPFSDIEAELTGLIARLGNRP